MLPVDVFSFDVVNKSTTYNNPNTVHNAFLFQCSLAYKYLTYDLLLLTRTT